MKRIAILMTCYNRVDTTLECLQRLFSQEMPDGYSFDVWLVDDASPDGTGEKVKAAYPQVNVISGTGKLFWCKGMRLAWECAAQSCDYDFYFWLNDDTFLFEDGLAIFISDAELCPDALIAGAIKSSESDRICYGINCAGGYCRPAGHPQLVRGGMNGNAVLIPKSVFRKIGFIDAAYSHGFGDYDYADMARRSGIGTAESSKAVGFCTFNPGEVGKTRCMGLFQRLRLLFSPKGFPLSDTWHYRRKFHGTPRAVASCLHVAYLVLWGRR